LHVSEAESADPVATPNLAALDAAWQTSAREVRPAFSPRDLQ
jgi:hypothetical protein